MKTTIRQWGTLLLASLVISSCTKNNNEFPGSNLYTLNGETNGNQVVPAVSGNGTATLTGTYNPTSRLFSYSAGWNGLSGAPVTAGFFTGPAGENGIAAGLPWTFEEGTAASGKVSGSVYLTPEQAQELISGQWYYVFGTNNYPAGEVRGQINAVR